jgi:hypothetical protein
MKWLKKFENFQKNKWELLLANPDKMMEGKSLIDLVYNAYSNTTLGSFVSSIRDVVKSHWFVIDFDKEEGLDACIFYRESRENENWIGRKIQGIGHDGEQMSKRIVIEKLINLLSEEGTWVEASDKLEETLEKKGCKKITDLEILSRLFPKSKIDILENGQYQRTLESGKIVKESVFGLPKLK